MLINFYGIECPHCIRMHTLFERLEKEEGIKTEKLEVWHDDANMKKLETYDKNGECGGVPFTVNTETGKTLCGEVEYDELKKWVKGK